MKIDKIWMVYKGGLTNSAAVMYSLWILLALWKHAQIRTSELIKKREEDRLESALRLHESVLAALTRTEEALLGASDRTCLPQEIVCGLSTTLREGLEEYYSEIHDTHSEEEILKEVWIHMKKQWSNLEQALPMSNNLKLYLLKPEALRMTMAISKRSHDINFIRSSLDPSTASTLLINCLRTTLEEIMELDESFMTAYSSDEHIRLSFQTYVQHWRVSVDGWLLSTKKEIYNFQHTRDTNRATENRGVACKTIKKKNKKQTNKNQFSLAGTPSCTMSEHLNSTPNDWNIQQGDTSTSYTLVSGKTPSVITSRETSILTLLKDMATSENSTPTSENIAKISCSISKRSHDGFATTKVPLELTTGMYYELNVYDLKDMFKNKVQKDMWKCALLRVKRAIPENSTEAMNVLQTVQRAEHSLRTHPKATTQGQSRF